MSVFSLNSVSPLQFTKEWRHLEEKRVFSYEDKYFIKFMSVSPNGSHIVITNEDNSVMVYKLDEQLMQENLYYDLPVTNDTKSSINHSDDMNSELFNDSSNSTNSYIQYQARFEIGESIFDTKWYPLMNSADKNTHLFATSSRDHPIHLWDMITGKIRCSYSGYDHYDELDSAYSFTFNLTGDKLYAGTNRMIRVFDVSYPGRNYIEIPTCKTRNEYSSQKGIISTMSFNPDYSQSYAIGSYADSIGIYVENMEGCALEIRDLNIGGISCLKWSPCGKMLWAGGRNCDIITCWDVRNTQTELGQVSRELHTNQKLSFDIDPWGKYLASGSQNGEIVVYDTNTFQLHAKICGNISNESKLILPKKRKLTDDTIDMESSSSSSSSSSLSSSSKIDSILTTYTSSLNMNMDCVNSVAFHPYSSLLLTSSGQRHFDYSDREFNATDESESDDDDDDDDDDRHPIQNQSVANIRSSKVHSKLSRNNDVRRKDISSCIHIWKIHANKLSYPLQG